MLNVDNDCNILNRKKIEKNRESGSNSKWIELITFHAKLIESRTAIKMIGYQQRLPAGTGKRATGVKMRKDGKNTCKDST